MATDDILYAMWGRSRAAITALGLSALGASACELVLPIDGYQGDASAGDGSTTDRSAGDGGSDVASDTSEDRSIASDADADADADAQDAASSDAGDWCASQEAGYLLCSDFDLPDSGITQGFDPTYVYTGLGGNFGPDTTTPFSAPRSAVATPMPFSPGGTAGIQLQGELWTLGPTHANVTCSLEWKVNTPLPKNMGLYSHILFLSLFAEEDASAPARAIGINILEDGTLQFLDNVNSDPDAGTIGLIGTFAGGSTWTHVELSLTNSGGMTNYRAVVGGVTGSGVLMVPLPTTSKVALLVGPAYYAMATTAYTPSWTFDYDNVICY